MSVSIEAIQSALKDLKDPYTGEDFIAAKAAKNIRVESGHVMLDIVLGYPARGVFAEIRDLVTRHLKAIRGVESVVVNVRSEIVTHAVQRGVTPVKGVKNIIAVSSGKGGVGKSTTAVNLALALAAEGARVGLLDADIYGPSQPQMLGIVGRPNSSDGTNLEPMEAYGVQAMSIGFLIDPDQPMVWRGPMVTQALEQLFRNTAWDNIDYLIIDMPPGTGDIQLTLSQKIPVTGAIIVTTPQDIATLDARKGLKMFEKVGIPILGVVENMSIHTCANCGHSEHIFGTGGADLMSRDYGVEVLGHLPLSLRIREETDAGRPTVVADPDSEISKIYREIARKVAVRIAKQQRDYSSKFPKISIQNT